TAPPPGSAPRRGAAHHLADLRGRACLLGRRLPAPHRGGGRRQRADPGAAGWLRGLGCVARGAVASRDPLSRVSVAARVALRRDLRLQPEILRDHGGRGLGVVVLGVDLQIHRRLLDLVIVETGSAESLEVVQLVELAAVGVLDPPLLLPLAHGEPHEADRAAVALDRLPHAGGKPGTHGRLRSEGEEQGATGARGLLEHVEPELLAQSDERLAAEGEHRGQRVHHEMVVEDRIAQATLERPCGGELPGGCGAVEDDQLHPNMVGPGDGRDQRKRGPRPGTVRHDRGKMVHASLVTLFEGVRNLPYDTAAAYDAEGLRAQGRGNCVAKAALLAEELGALEVPCRTVSWEYELPLLVDVQQRLGFRTDIHTAVQAHVGGRWVLVDATHDPPLDALGLPVGRWDGRSATEPAYQPIGPRV